jgi:AmiR/NasT family two-component response regulator
MEDDVDDFIHCGVDAVITKPLTLATLKKLLDKVREKGFKSDSNLRGRFI